MLYYLNGTNGNAINFRGLIGLSLKNLNDTEDKASWCPGSFKAGGVLESSGFRDPGLRSALTLDWWEGPEYVTPSSHCSQPVPLPLGVDPAPCLLHVSRASGGSSKYISDLDSTEYRQASPASQEFWNFVSTHLPNRISFFLVWLLPKRKTSLGPAHPHAYWGMSQLTCLIKSWNPSLPSDLSKIYQLERISPLLCPLLSPLAYSQDI